MPPLCPSGFLADLGICRLNPSVPAVCRRQHCFFCCWCPPSLGCSHLRLVLRAEWGLQLRSLHVLFALFCLLMGLSSVVLLLRSWCLSQFLVIAACVSVTIFLVLSLITDCMFSRSSAVALSSNSSRNVFLRSVRSEAFALCFTCVWSFLTHLSRSIYFCAIFCTSETTPIAAGLQWPQYQIMAVFSFADKNS